MHTILYVMRHIDIGGHIEIPYKKVGITGSGSATLSTRLQQISNTKSPIKALCVAAWEHKDARTVETALHSFMEDSRVEGEWFLDKDNTLVERMVPIMELIGASPITLEESDDAHTKSILKREIDKKQESDHILLGQMSGLLKQSLRSTSRERGLTFFSIKKQLTYYVNSRATGMHQLHIGRSKGIFLELKNFLELKSYDVEETGKGDVMISGIPCEVIAEAINAIEADFN